MTPHKEIIKAFQKKLAADDMASDFYYGANKARVTRADNELAKKINKHYPDLSQQEKINLYAELYKAAA